MSKRDSQQQQHRTTCPDFGDPIRYAVLCPGCGRFVLNEHPPRHRAITLIASLSVAAAAIAVMSWLLFSFS